MHAGVSEGLVRVKCSEHRVLVSFLKSGVWLVASSGTNGAEQTAGEKNEPHGRNECKYFYKQAW